MFEIFVDECRVGFVGGCERFMYHEKLPEWNITHCGDVLVGSVELRRGVQERVEGFSGIPVYWCSWP